MDRKDHLMTADEMINIREMSERSSVSASTLRYYEKLGLITSERGRSGSHRRYSESTFHRVIYITLAQRAGRPGEDGAVLHPVQARDAVRGGEDLVRGDQGAAAEVAVAGGVFGRVRGVVRVQLVFLLPPVRDPVAVAVTKRLDVKLVNDGVLVPERIHRCIIRPLCHVITFDAQNPGAQSTLNTFEVNQFRIGKPVDEVA